MSFDCKYCYLAFTERYERYRHFKDSHPEEYHKGKGRCFLCNVECPNFMVFFDHVEQEHAEQAYQIKMRSSSYEEREQGDIVLGAWMLKDGYLKDGDGPITLNEIVKRNRRLRRSQDGDYSSEDEEDEEEDWPASTSAEGQAPIEPQAGAGEAPPTTPSPAPTEGYLDDNEMEKDQEATDAAAVEEMEFKPVISRMPSNEEVYALYHYNEKDDEESGEDQSENRKRRHSEDPIEAAKKHRGLSIRNPNVPLDAPISVITETIEKTDSSTPAAVNSSVPTPVHPLPPTEAPLPFGRHSLPPQPSSAASSSCSTPHVQQILQQPPQAFPFPSPIQHQHPMACMEQLANQGRPSSASLYPPPTREQLLQLQQFHQQQLLQQQQQLRGPAPAPPPPPKMMTQQECNAMMLYRQQMIMMHQMGAFMGTTPSPQNLPMRTPMGMQPWSGSMGPMNGMGMTSPQMGLTFPGTFPALNQTPSPLILPTQQMQFNGFAGPLTPSSMFSNSSEVEKKEDEKLDTASSSTSTVSNEQITTMSGVFSIMKNNNNGQAKLPEDGNNEGFEGMPVLTPTQASALKQSPQPVPSFNPTATIKICESDSTELDQFLPPTMQLEGRCEGEIPEENQLDTQQMMLRILQSSQSSLPLANAPPSEMDRDYWNCKLDGSCLRCGSCSAGSQNARKIHYKKYHYDTFYALQPKITNIERWLSIRLGMDTNNPTYARVCLHCPVSSRSRESHLGRGRLLEHIKKFHPEVFWQMGREYTMTFIDSQTTDVNIHRLLVSAAATIAVLPN